jgi:hypothetical protein
VGGVLGGSVGVLLLGMTSTLVLGRGFDAAGLILGALTGLALMYGTPSLRGSTRL